MCTEAAHLRLLTWFSPAFPVGAFAWSHGLETAIREARVAGAADLRAWIEGLLEHGSGWTDAVLFKLAWGEPERLAEIAELAEALAPSLERHKETMALGTAFTQAVKPWLQSSSPLMGEGLGWGCRTDAGGSVLVGAELRSIALVPAPTPYPDLSPIEGERSVNAALPYPVAAGFACASAGVPLEAALTAWTHGFAANLVSVGVRAIPIGQSEATGILAALEPLILETAARAAFAGEDDLGACAFLSDIAAMRHETLQPRLFIS